MWKRIILAGLLGGIAMFVWSSVAHLATPLAFTGLQEIPNEQPFLAAMQNQLGDAHGLYFFPGTGLAPDATSAQRRAAMPQVTEKMKTGPSGLLLYHPAGHGVTFTPRRLFHEFLIEFCESLLAAWLLAQTRLITYVRKVLFVVVVGIAAAMTTNLPYYNWYGFPRRYTGTYMFVEVVGYMCAGLVIAWLLKPAVAPATTRVHA